MWCIYFCSRIPVLWISLTRSGAVIQMLALFSRTYIVWERQAHNQRTHHQYVLTLNLIQPPYNNCAKIVAFEFTHFFPQLYGMLDETVALWSTQMSLLLINNNRHVHTNKFLWRVLPPTGQPCKLTATAASTHVNSLLISATGKPPSGTVKASLRPRNSTKFSIFQSKTSLNRV